MKEILSILISLHSILLFGQPNSPVVSTLDFYAVYSDQPLEREYRELADSIIATDAPRGGDFKSDYGELLFYIEGLRDEACRNGNINWRRNDEGKSAKWIRYVLGNDSNLFPKAIEKEIKRDVGQLLNFRRPCIDITIYDRLVRRALEYYKERQGYYYEDD